MTCEPCTYSQESAEDSLQTSSLDTRQLSLLSGNTSNVKFSAKGRKRDGSQILKSGKGTYNFLTGPHTKEKWIAFMRDSLVKICQMQGKEKVWGGVQEAASTPRFYELLAKYDQSTSSLKMSQLSFILDSKECFPTGPRWGFMQGGAAYALPMSERHIKEIDGGYWLPTPLKSDHMKFGKFKLASVLKPTFGTHVNSIPYYMAAQHGRIPSVDLLTWAMGFPNGWAHRNHLVTPKSRCKPQSHGNSSEVNK